MIKRKGSELTDKHFYSFSVHDALDWFSESLNRQSYFLDGGALDTNEFFIEWLVHIWTSYGLVSIDYEVQDDEALYSISKEMYEYESFIMYESRYIRSLFNKLKIPPDTVLTLRLVGGVIFVYLETL